MPRMRILKPGFFQNEKLADVQPLGRILFAGLWTEADREGRLEDRPRRIKASVLPYDDCDINLLLHELQEQGFILRYEVNGSSYIQIVNFTKHQQPHHKEVHSLIPAPLESSLNQAWGKDDSSLNQASAKDEPSLVQADRALTHRNMNGNQEQEHVRVSRALAQEFSETAFTETDYPPPPETNPLLKAVADVTQTDLDHCSPTRLQKISDTCESLRKIERGKSDAEIVPLVAQFSKSFALRFQKNPTPSLGQVVDEWLSVKNARASPTATKSESWKQDYERRLQTHLELEYSDGQKMVINQAIRDLPKMDADEWRARLDELQSLGIEIE